MWELQIKSQVCSLPEVHLKVLVTHEVNELDFLQLPWGPIIW